MVREVARLWSTAESGLSRVADAALGRRTDRPPAAASGKNVLVVDDEHDARTHVATLLTERGFSVTAAASGEEALRASARQPFDLVLLDARMPGIDGIEAFRRLRRDRPALRVVMMSSYHVDQLQRAALGEGAAAFLRKPLDWASLERLVG